MHKYFESLELNRDQASAPAAPPMAVEKLGRTQYRGKLVAHPLGPTFNLVGGVICLVGLLIRLGLMLHWGAADLAVKLLLLYFHKDSIGCMRAQAQFLKKSNREATVV